MSRADHLDHVGRQDWGHARTVGRAGAGRWRRIPLPGSVEADKVTAAFKNGVLTVTLPKPPEAQATRKQIEVKKG